MQQDFGGEVRNLFVLFAVEYGSGVHEQTDAQAGLAILCSRNKRNGRHTGARRPVPASSISNRDQRFPTIGITVLDRVRQLWPRHRSLGGCPQLDQAIDLCA